MKYLITVAKRPSTLFDLAGGVALIALLYAALLLL